VDRAARVVALQTPLPALEEQALVQFGCTPLGRVDTDARLLEDFGVLADRAPEPCLYLREKYARRANARGHFLNRRTVALDVGGELLELFELGAVGFILQILGVGTQCTLFFS
jgi:hypothetical protein